MVVVSWSTLTLGWTGKVAQPCRFVIPWCLVCWCINSKRMAEARTKIWYVRAFPLDVETILKIRLVVGFSRDDIIWNYDSKGCFSMRNTYYLASSLESCNEVFSSFENPSLSLWNSLWKADSFLRAQHYFWGIIQDILQTKVIS